VSDSVPVFTIGYGSRTVHELAEAVRGQAVECLVDVRSAPYSRYRPEFSREALERAVAALGLRYLFLGAELGGRPQAPECYVEGKVDYDRVRRLDAYRAGLERISELRGSGTRLALMCSEGRPEECHRSRLIGASLAESGIPVVHIDEAGQLRTQEEVIGRITGGQLTLFGEPAFTSRKRYPDGR